MRSLVLFFAASVALFAGETDWIETLGGSVTRDTGGRITGVDLRVHGSPTPICAGSPVIRHLPFWTCRLPI